jgi:hypothetical protein
MGPCLVTEGTIGIANKNAMGKFVTVPLQYPKASEYLLSETNVRPMP